MHDSSRGGFDDRSLVRRQNHTAAAISQRAAVSAAFDGGRDEQANLFEYWRMLCRHKWILVSAGSLGLLIAAGISMLLTPSYRARASLEIQGFNENFLNIKDLDPTTSGSFTAESNLLTQIQILQSESLLERVVTKVGAEQREQEGRRRGRGYRWLHRTKRHDAEPLPNLKAAVSHASASLRVRLIGQTRIVELIYQASTPELAADFINTLAGEYIERIQEARWNSSQQTAAWLARNLQELKIKLENSEDQLQAYARAAGLTLTSATQSSGQPDNLDEQKLRSLQEELLRAQADRVARQSRFEAVGALAAESLSEILEDNTLRAYQTTLTDLRRQLADLRTSLTEAHPKVIRVQAQIAEMEGALTQERRKILRAAESDYHSAQRREQLVLSAYSAQATRVSDLTAKIVHYNLLKREVDTNRQMYDTMLQKAKEAGVAAAMRATTAVLVDAAKPPLWPYQPNLPLNSGIGLLAGLLVGTGWILIRERADQTVRAPGEAPAFLDLPELGIIPSAELSGVTGLKGLRHSFAGVLPAPADAANGHGAAGDGRAAHNQTEKVELVTWRRKQSILADSYRSTMNSLLFSERPGGQPRLIVITSPAPMDGKTTAVTNLGIALAEIGRKVLLIDADTRRPQLHQIFALPNNRGLTNIRDDARVFDLQALEKLVRHTEVPGLYVIPSGPRAPSVSRLLHSDRMAELVATVRRDFDVVLIDAPPVLLPDARVLGRLSDGVILVLRSGSTNRDAAFNACERFLEDGTPVLGTILSHFDPNKTAGRPYGHPYHAAAYYYGSAKHSG